MTRDEYAMAETEILESINLCLHDMLDAGEVSIEAWVGALIAHACLQVRSSFPPGRERDDFVTRMALLFRATLETTGLVPRPEDPGMN